ncbi:hypothetical protein [Rhodococcus sp. NCIMB 12038]|uniref:hypothetical protein n=1 Tax=Rhodococcus sp. NCIMB 12038 TaxID=933800 RepID=UPI000B3C0AAA|nr:hypothetical protein [Rhodococcus sp. NCIMB 12038]OUS97395.1 hypothetical protein CA951_03370 [Rhodococcus sp. NCIMB 12038]
MTRLDHAPYTEPFRSTWTSYTGVALKAFEGDINRAIAALGSSDNEDMRWAIVQMITPALTEADLEDRRIPYVTESGDGVDWVVTYPDVGTVLGICEHKPLGAPAHGAWASHSLLSDKTAVVCEEGYLEEVAANIEVLDSAVFTEEQLTDLRYWTYKAVPGGMRSSIDQVLKYRADYDGRFPCHILSDQGTSVNEIYLLRGKDAPHRPYRYVDTAFPVHSTADALNRLAAALAGVDLTPAEKSDVTRVVDAMWMRGPVAIDHDLTDAAKTLVSAAARDAGYNKEIEWQHRSRSHAAEFAADQQSAAGPS